MEQRLACDTKTWLVAFDKMPDKPNLIIDTIDTSHYECTPQKKGVKQEVKNKSPRIVASPLAALLAEPDSKKIICVLCMRKIAYNDV